MNIALWIVQFLLAFAFGFAGFLKLTQPMEKLVAQMVWPGALPEALVRFIGASELLGALGLLLPSLLRLKPGLTPLAALGLTVVMLLAAGFHLMRGEFAAIGFNSLFGAMTLFVAWGRFKKVPILPREK